MRSDVDVYGVEVIDVGDKGFSVGEMSNVRINNFRVQSSAIGVAVKDLSFAEIKNAEFADNVVAMSVYSKNWRFGGPGKMSVKNVKFRRNNVEVDIEELAEVTVLAGVDINVTTGDGKLNYVH